TTRLVADEEFLPFPKEHFDLVMSSLSLHWVNDLQSTFDQIRDTLKPDGAFLGAVLGGDSLQELRYVYYIQVDYPNAFVLMEHLRGMGENHAVQSQGTPVTRESLLAAASIYQTMFGQPDGTVPATFQVIYLIGWSPHESQQKPLRRGSAQHSLKELGHS
ncbi:hypothetical protein BBJ28_00011859, partial [Nothophytophthora sp. Chile5]